jgi:hypothetical protein
VHVQTWRRRTHHGEGRNVVTLSSINSLTVGTRKEPNRKRIGPANAAVEYRQRLCGIDMNPILCAAKSLSFIILACGIVKAAEASDVTVMPAKPPLRVERVPLESGAELITLFERLPDGPPSTDEPELPLLSILKDTLKDSDRASDRIRQVWVHTYSHPSIWQRIAGGIPFLYHRAGLDRGPGPRPPNPTIDLGDPSRGMWTGLALSAAQSEVLDPIGALARLTTHSFFGNYGEYRKTHVWEAGDVISSLPIGSLDVGLTEDEIEAVEERLELAGHPLGGLVGDQYLGRDHEKLRARQTETRGHNWELLRQSAENAGLYLEPLEPDGLPASFAILWVAETDLEGAPRRNFDRQFLNISNPFSDERLRRWNGYSETWYRDGNGVPVSADSDGSQAVCMIPLALYALDHPHTPLLLADFRGSGHPQRREIGLKFAEDATSGVLSITGYGRLGYITLKSSWMFVHSRHGGATNRSARRRAFVLVRHAIGSDPGLEPSLRKELLGRIEKVDLNPIESSWDQEIRDGWRQYNALITYARATGLAREIARDRGDEVSATIHGTGARALLHLASIGTVGLYRHHDAVNQSLMAKLEQQRRSAWLKSQGQNLPPASQPVVASASDSTPLAMRPVIGQ